LIFGVHASGEDGQSTLWTCLHLLVEARER
jgi:hypothetical protein